MSEKILNFVSFKKSLIFRIIKGIFKIKMLNYLKNRKLKINFLVLLYSFTWCLFMSGCGNNTEQSENNKHSDISEYSKNLNSYSLHLNLDRNALENLLTFKKEENEYKLIPATNSKKDLEFWINLVTKDKDYIKTYFLNREPIDADKARNKFNSTIKSMWYAEKPDSLMFIILLNNNYAGIIKCTDLSVKNAATVGFITAKEYCGQGVATHGLRMFLELIKYLKDTKVCETQTISLWIFDDNLASLSVAKNIGFTFAKYDNKNKRARYDFNL